MFFDRKVELKQLSDLYQSDRGEMFILYGRRRVGKTELLRHFCNGKPHIFFIATLSSDQEQLAVFSRQIYAMIHSTAPENFSYPSWESAFQALAELPDVPRPIVVLDEFTYLISGNKAIPSILQKVWDETLKNSRVMLVLCGSYIGMMETEVMGYQSPLYGRRTGSSLLRPLDLPSSSLFHPGYSSDTQFLAWAILGGMPYYLSMFADSKDLFTNIRDQILNPQTGTLFNEPRLLLMEELREPRNYFSILRAIAQGNTRLNEIGQASGVGEPTTVARYLDILRQMRLIIRRVPVTESQPEKSKKGLYQIEDHFLRFWFRYVQPNQSNLDLGLAEAILEKRIRPDLDHFSAFAFEEACQAFVAQLARKGNLSFLPDRVGGWWDRQSELDVVALSGVEKSALVGDCKWSIHPVGTDVLDDLLKKTIPWKAEYGMEHIEYALFSRAGFTPALMERASAERVNLYTITDLLHSPE